MDNVYAFTGVLSSELVHTFQEKIATATFSDGKATASGAASTVKNNEQALLENVDGLRELFQQHVATNAAIRRMAMPRSFSSMLISRYREGMGYGTHTDSAILNSGKRSDLSFTLFLSDKSDYDGGELVLETTFGEQSIRLDPGSLILYPTGYQHRVNPVIRGERLVIVGWIESRIRDGRKRKIITDLAEARIEYVSKLGEDATSRKLIATIENLRRLWDE